ncbi:hypothetical protein Tco_1006780 [Tanacetum coccineum]|uniref:Reverse transcriptase domain-containing protein n=1 Tax=Tanacetum coccineum TaxID=301880 RepID=A0ABQ5FL25_9ASTR
MRTRSQSRRRRQQQTIPVVENLEPIVAMADNRTMAQMLQAPIEGYEDAIVVPPINANNFELKQPLINLVQSNKFTGRQDPHNHLRFFNKVTSTFRHPEVPNTSIKLLLFPFSLDGEARDWLDKEPPRSILTWDDLVSKFINIFFPPSLRKPEFISPKQNHHFIPDTTTTPFNEAWDRLKGLLRKTAPPMAFGNYNQLDDFFTIHLKACSFLLCAYLDFEPFVIVFMSLLSCDLVSLTTLLILWLYLESFKSEFAEVFVFKILKLSLDITYRSAVWMMTLEGFPLVIVNTKEYHLNCSGNITHMKWRRTLDKLACEPVVVQQVFQLLSLIEAVLVCLQEQTFGTSYELDCSFAVVLNSEF